MGEEDARKSQGSRAVYTRRGTDRSAIAITACVVGTDTADDLAVIDVQARDHHRGEDGAGEANITMVQQRARKRTAPLREDDTTDGP